MTNDITFEEYWAGRAESLREVLIREGQIEMLKFEAKKAWTIAKQTNKDENNNV